MNILICNELNTHKLSVRKVGLDQKDQLEGFQRQE
jgi:hypothetical protein